MAKKKKVIMGRPVKYPGVWKKFPMYFRTAAEIKDTETARHAQSAWRTKRFWRLWETGF